MNNFLLTHDNNYLLFLNKYSNFINIYSNKEINNNIQNQIEFNLIPFMRIKLINKLIDFKIIKNYLLLINNDKIEIINYDNLLKNMDNLYNIYNKNNKELELIPEIIDIINIKKNFNYKFINETFIQLKDNKIYFINIFTKNIRKLQYDRKIIDFIVNKDFIFCLLDNKNIIKTDILNFNNINNYELDIDNENNIKILEYKNSILLYFENQIHIYEIYNLKFINKIEIDFNINFIQNHNNNIIIIDCKSYIYKYDIFFNLIFKLKSDLICITNCKKLNINDSGIYNNCFIFSNIQGLCEIKIGNITKSIGYNI